MLSLFLPQDLFICYLPPRNIPPQNLQMTDLELNSNVTFSKNPKFLMTLTKIDLFS